MTVDRQSQNGSDTVKPYLGLARTPRCQPRKKECRGRRPATATLGLFRLIGLGVPIRALLRSVDDLGRFDRDRLDGNVFHQQPGNLWAGNGMGRRLADLVNDFGAFDHFSENSIAVAVSQPLHD